MKKYLILIAALTMATFAAACGNTNDANRNAANTNATTGSTTNANTATTNNAATANTTGTGNSTSTAGGGDVPAAVRAAVADAQTFAAQHKDLPASAITSIEKETGTKVTDKDHHAYLAFSTSSGARRQVGAATVVKAGGQEMVIVYDSKEGSPMIREVRGSGVPAAFLEQFKGKGHDNPLKFGQDIKAQGAPETLAQGATNAIKADVIAMQALYGSAHSH